EVGSGQQIQMYLDRPLHITPLAEQLADGDMGLDRFRVDLKGPDEGLDSLVRMLVEQVVESDEILLVDGAAVGCQHDADPDCLAAPKEPADSQRRHEQAEEQQFLHIGQPLTAWVRSLSISLR